MSDYDPPAVGGIEEITPVRTDTERLMDAVIAVSLRRTFGSPYGKEYVLAYSDGWKDCCEAIRAYLDAEQQKGGDAK